jgi:methylated-DNA-[protein]-cysteine S-methyltransferase
MTTTPLPSYHSTTFATPVGKFSLATDGAGAVVAAAFGSQAALQRRLGAGKLQRDARRTAPLRREVEAYFSTGRRKSAAVLAPAGTPFQQRVWRALQEIPFGQTRSYGQLAALLRSSPRAVGRAIGANPICLLIPCHRVNGADGSLTGYAFGLRIKRLLLEREAALPARSRRKR